MKFQELLNELQHLEFTELVDIYLEAKTGKNTTAEDLLPVQTVDLIYEIAETIKEFTE